MKTRTIAGLLLILAARVIAAIIPRRLLPDWIEAAANFNVRFAASAVEEIVRLAEAEDQHLTGGEKC